MALSALLPTAPCYIPEFLIPLLPRVGTISIFIVRIILRFFFVVFNARKPIQKLIVLRNIFLRYAQIPLVFDIQMCYIVINEDVISIGHRGRQLEPA